MNRKKEVPPRDAAAEPAVPAAKTWRVRIGIPGGVFYVLSRVQPKVTLDKRRLVSVEMDVIEDTADGDTIGFIDWSAVASVTWRLVE